MQRLDIRSRLRRRPSPLEHRRGTPKQLAFPLRDLIRMNIEPRGQLRQSLFAPAESVVRWSGRQITGRPSMASIASIRHGEPAVATTFRGEFKGVQIKARALFN